MTSLQEALAAAAVQGGAHTETPDVLKLHVLDTLGCLMAGWRSPVTEQLAAAVGVDTSTAPGVGRTRRTLVDALVAGTAVHLHDFDDYSPRYGVHPGAVIVPALLALDRPLSGRTFLSATHVGYETALVLSRVVLDNTTPRPSTSNGDAGHGFHTTGVVGPIAAATAVGTALGADTHRLAATIAAATSSSASRTRNFPSPTKATHAGVAAFGGALAALTSAARPNVPGVLDDLISSLTGRADLDLTAVDSFGEMASSAAAIKRHASCGLTQSLVDLVLKLRREMPQIARVIIAVDSRSRTSLPFDRPCVPAEARFSLPYIVSAALAAGRVGLEEILTVGSPPPEVDRLIRATDVTVEDRESIAVTLIAPNGAARQRSTAMSDGPADREVTIEKFRANAAFFGMPEDTAEALCTRVLALDDLPDVRLLVPGASYTNAESEEPAWSG